MYQTGLLLLTGPLRLVIESISQYLKCANKNVVKLLYVKLEPEFNRPFSKSDTVSLKRLSSVVPLVYNKASAVCRNLDVRVMLSDSKHFARCNEETSNFDVILTNSNDDDNNIKHYVDLQFKRNCSNIIKLQKIENSVSDIKYNTPVSEFLVYKTVCLGGTFDRLHNGHKVLLSEAILRATEKLIVGVTNGPMLKRKVLSELIDPVEKRIDEVSTFLIDVDPSLHYEVVPIIDPYGPTITNPDINCIIVSAETRTGGVKVNEERKKRGMTELTMYVVDLVENFDKSPEEEEKMSSSTARMQLLGTPLNSKIVPKTDNPYCILLQGQPLSGKSCIVTYFQALGVFIVCCDDIIQSVLSSDRNLSEEICLKLRENLIHPDGSFDYQKLMVICLKDKKNRLNFATAVSDKVNLAVQQKLLTYTKQGAEIILLKDSVLLDGKLKCDINESWSTLLPASEVSKRLKKHYNLTDEEATNVTLSIPSNEEYLQKSNIVFCNQWTIENTKKQAERAWSHLQSTVGVKYKEAVQVH